MAEFLEVPISSVQRAFTLSLKAKPKKKSNATAPMDGGTTSAWSDEVQSPLITSAWSDEVQSPLITSAWSDEVQSPLIAADGAPPSVQVRKTFIETRLREAKSSAEPPRCCGAWTQEFVRQPVVRVLQPEPPRRAEHWFSEWAARAAPPRRAQNISITHVINPFYSEHDAEHARAQEITIASISHAVALANTQGVRVDVVCAMFPEDAARLPQCAQQGFAVALLNVSVATLLPSFRHHAKLPFLNMILYVVCLLIATDGLGWPLASKSLPHQVRRPSGDCIRLPPSSGTPATSRAREST